MPRADLGWLRVVAIGMVFLIHAAQPFNPWDRWHIVNADRTRVLGEVALFGAPWVMPLFLYLAGAGAWYSLSRRAPGAFLARRVRRIGIPLVVGVLVLVPPQVWLERRAAGAFDGSLFAFYPRFFDGVYPAGNFSLHHLWFLALLLVVTALALPVLQGWRGPEGRARLTRWSAVLEGRWGLAWMLAAVAALRAATWWAFADARYIAWDWSARVLLLPAFLLGAASVASAGVQRAVDRHWRPAAALALAGSLGFALWAWPGDLLTRLPAPRSAYGASLWALYGVTSWSWVVALAGAAHRYLRRDEARAHALAQGVYPFYLLHQPVIVAVAAVVVPLGHGVAWKVLVVWTVALAISLALSGVMLHSGPARRLVGLDPAPRAARRSALA